MQINEDVSEIFKDSGFEKNLKSLALQFGSKATLEDVHNAFRALRPVPEHVINGFKYKAGYFFIKPGQYDAILIDIRQHGGMCKLMFEIDASGYFLYFNYPLENLKVENIVNLAKYIDRSFMVVVQEEVIKNTGDKHCVIQTVVGFDNAAGL